MTRGDILGLILSYVYAFGMLFIVEAIGKGLKWPLYFTRKIIHIGAGLWVWGILYFFDHWYWGIIPFATFIILNYVFYKQQSFKAMDDEESTPGTVYFAVSISVLFVALWRTGGQPDRVYIATAAVMAMTLGDAMASIIGRKWGTRAYTVFGHRRTWEGSAAMLVFGMIGIVVSLLLIPGSALSPNSAALETLPLVVMLLAGGVVAAVAEALTPAGMDNLSVPLMSGLVMWIVDWLL